MPARGALLAEGNIEKRLTHEPYEDYNPTWSPDGKWIAFARDIKGVADVWVMAADGPRCGASPTTRTTTSRRLVGGQHEAPLREQPRRRLQRLRDDARRDERQASDEQRRGRPLPELAARPGLERGPAGLLARAAHQAADG